MTTPELDHSRQSPTGRVDALPCELESDHYCGRCPACGEFCDYCQGHGDVGDPAGALILRWHDQGTHSACHALSDCS